MYVAWRCGSGVSGRDYTRCSLGRVCTGNSAALLDARAVVVVVVVVLVMRVKDQSPTVVVVEMKSNDEARGRPSQPPRSAPTRPSMHYDGKSPRYALPFMNAR